MTKKRDKTMNIRIPAEGKIAVQGIADHADVTLSDAVIKGLRDFLQAARPLSKEDYKSPNISGETICIRIPEDLKIRLQKIAAEVDISLSKVGIRGISDFLESQRELIQQLESSGALQQLRNKLEEIKKTRTRWDGSN